jgi:hypothetical protein
MLHKTAPRSERKLRLRRQETRVVFFSSGPVNFLAFKKLRLADRSEREEASPTENKKLPFVFLKKKKTHSK